MLVYAWLCGDVYVVRAPCFGQKPWPTDNSFEFRCLLDNCLRRINICVTVRFIVTATKLDRSISGWARAICFCCRPCLWLRSGSHTRAIVCTKRFRRHFFSASKSPNNLDESEWHNKSQTTNDERWHIKYNIESFRTIADWLSRSAHSVKWISVGVTACAQIRMRSKHILRLSFIVWFPCRCSRTLPNNNNNHRWTSSMAGIHPRVAWEFSWENWRMLCVPFGLSNHNSVVIKNKYRLMRMQYILWL